MSMFKLWRMLSRRGSSSSSHSTALAVIAFGAATAIFLTVLGGVHGFVWRASPEHTLACTFDACRPAGSEASTETMFNSAYVALAFFACLLLLVPFATLAGSAARLCAARRDERLSALRLAGATTSQVVRLTAFDTVAQALAGALAGIVGYLLLMPAIMLLNFQGRHFSFQELWVGLPTLALTTLGVGLLALLASLSTLRKVAITPLGVSSRVSAKQPGIWRFLLVVAVFAFALLSFRSSALEHVGQVIATVFVVGIIVVCYALLNLLGPWVISTYARWRVRHPRSVASLIAMRRVLDNPKRAWRNVSGIALAVFIAGITSVSSFGASPDEAPVTPEQVAAISYEHDIGTGGLLTLAFAAVLAAVSCGIMQAGNVYDQEGEYRTLALEGMDLRTLNRARFSEVLSPLAVVVVVSAACSVALMLPFVSNALTQPQTIITFAAGIALCFALVSVGAFASNRVAASLNLLNYRADD
ncbi:transporter [Bombiscardovia nodaiensis]|uniref:Transporter n=1 Tax=Bombiscardovia nodaiensis TaxID=2932181 RepID=A0ABM8B9U2_9BIFI|nr:transporter [Bombiscardovia nodaiensis]